MTNTSIYVDGRVAAAVRAVFSVEADNNNNSSAPLTLYANERQHQQHQQQTHQTSQQQTHQTSQHQTQQQEDGRRHQQHHEKQPQTAKRQEQLDRQNLNEIGGADVIDDGDDDDGGGSVSEWKQLEKQEQCELEYENVGEMMMFAAAVNDVLGMADEQKAKGPETVICRCCLLEEDSSNANYLPLDTVAAFITSITTATTTTTTGTTRAVAAASANDEDTTKTNAKDDESSAAHTPQHRQQQHLASAQQQQQQQMAHHHQEQQQQMATKQQHRDLLHSNHPEQQQKQQQQQLVGDPQLEKQQQQQQMSTTPTLLDCLNMCAHIKASCHRIERQLPQHICLDCSQALEACCEFIRCVQNADKILRGKLKRQQTGSDDVAVTFPNEVSTTPKDMPRARTTSTTEECILSPPSSEASQENCPEKRPSDEENSPAAAKRLKGGEGLAGYVIGASGCIWEAAAGRNGLRGAVEAATAAATATALSDDNDDDDGIIEEYSEEDLTSEHDSYATAIEDMSSKHVDTEVESGVVRSFDSGIEIDDDPYSLVASGVEEMLASPIQGHPYHQLSHQKSHHQPQKSQPMPSMQQSQPQQYHQAQHSNQKTQQAPKQPHMAQQQSHQSQQQSQHSFITYQQSQKTCKQSQTTYQTPHSTYQQTPPHQTNQRPHQSQQQQPNQKAKQSQQIVAVRQQQHPRQQQHQPHQQHPPHQQQSRQPQILHHQSPAHSTFSETAEKLHPALSPLRSSIDYNNETEQQQQQEQSQCHLELYNNNTYVVAASLRQRLSEFHCHTAHPASLKCGFCVYACHSKEQLARHLQQHLGPTRYNCNMCKFRCRFRYVLRKHKRVDHQLQETVYADLSTVIDRNTLLRSTTYSTAPTKYQCRTCGKYLMSLEALQQHTEMHEVELYECTRCPYNDIIRENVLEHLAAEHSILVDLSVVAQYIPLKSPLDSLYGHRASHALRSNAPLPLSTLPRLAASTALTKPAKKYGKFLCQFCGKCFERSFHLMKHEFRIHHIPMDDQAELKSKLLKKSSAKYAQLQYQRLRKAAQTERRFHCERCHKLFKTSPLLQQHRQTVHGEHAKFECDICGAEFMFNFDLKYHRRTHEVLQQRQQQQTQPRQHTKEQQHQQQQCLIQQMVVNCEEKTEDPTQIPPEAVRISLEPSCVAVEGSPAEVAQPYVTSEHLEMVQMEQLPVDLLSTSCSTIPDSSGDTPEPPSTLTSPPLNMLATPTTNYSSTEPSLLAELPPQPHVAPSLPEVESSPSCAAVPISVEPPCLSFDLFDDGQLYLNDFDLDLLAC